MTGNIKPIGTLSISTRILEHEGERYVRASDVSRMLDDLASHLDPVAALNMRSLALAFINSVIGAKLT